ncbi:phosphate signaling complex protein PhoU [Nitrospirillum sp. BR 11163]|uniref:phosphate signaling complex protein PhoU n=1 Tax=Nitrospirillum sp. BR 11163 TaxID=3104323 RepID=UPI002AFDF0DD|nr:phosphate signaling complex protein PhoU [Nitrospirillum sp. BR 11163]MEA1677332.1 phosphate signaling complex protein PhoU [Nitrospirillum sp. BR 11163]
MSEQLPRHIVTSYENELQRLDALLAEMGGRAEQQLEQATRAVLDRDDALARETVAQDQVLDALEHEVESLIIRLLALRHPMAIDLRHTLAALKAANALERVGDYAKNMAKRALVLNGVPAISATASVGRLSDLARKQLASAIEAFTRRDTALAADVWRRDAELDDMHAGVTQEIFAFVAKDASLIEACTSLQFIAKNLERVGDLATNIAEMVQFDATGTLVDPHRPRGGEAH